jgi:hypothetical protein
VVLAGDIGVVDVEHLVEGERAVVEADFVDEAGEQVGGRVFLPGRTDADGHGRVGQGTEAALRADRYPIERHNA